MPRKFRTHLSPPGGSFPVGPLRNDGTPYDLATCCQCLVLSIGRIKSPAEWREVTCQLCKDSDHYKEIARNAE